MFIGFVETQASIKKYLLSKYPFLLNHLIYLFDVMIFIEFYQD